VRTLREPRGRKRLGAELPVTWFAKTLCKETAQNQREFAMSEFRKPLALLLAET